MIFKNELSNQMGTIREFDFYAKSEIPLVKQKFKKRINKITILLE
jgi:hypothetical protein